MKPLLISCIAILTLLGCADTTKKVELTLLSRSENYEIKLLDPIPVFIEYKKVTRSDSDMIMYIDIYAREEEYLKIMRQ